MPAVYDWNQIVEDLNRLLRLYTTPIGMKLFTSVEEMEQIPKIRRPKAIHTTDLIVAMAVRLGWTVGITANVVGLPQIRHMPSARVCSQHHSRGKTASS